MAAAVFLVIAVDRQAPDHLDARAAAHLVLQGRHVAREMIQRERRSRDLPQVGPGRQEGLCCPFQIGHVLRGQLDEPALRMRGHLGPDPGPGPLDPVRQTVQVNRHPSILPAPDVTRKTPAAQG
jgi:hypothetical protein